MDGPLSRRIAALMKPSDVDPIRTAEPTLFKYLGTALAAVGLISVEETKPVEPRVLTDQALAEGWERGGEDGKLPIDLLAEAAARGLPWSMAAIAEVWELIHPYDDRDRDRIRDFMIGISDCPQERGKALPWIRKNALQLVWDAERKRWVLPEGTGK